MADTGLMSIGVFAGLAGLTVSALRFYDDAGVLRPEYVDPTTGYRFYRDAQVRPASQLRQLREIGMSLAEIATFFRADPTEAVDLIDGHVAKVAMDARHVVRTATALKASLEQPPPHTVCALAGPVLADAIDQVLATTMHDPEIPVLSGVHVDATPDSVTLTTTDRYRLTSRTLVPLKPGQHPWAGTLAGDDLRILTSPLRHSPTVIMDAGLGTVSFRLADDAVHPCRLLNDAFPDHRLLLSSLPGVTHRITIRKQQMLKVLEQRAPETVGLQISNRSPRLILPDSPRPHSHVVLDGSATGGDLTLWFKLTTVYPAISHAIGIDLMLDARGIDQPVTVRSADDGDLTTLVMPCQRPADMTNEGDRSHAREA